MLLLFWHSPFPSWELFLSSRHSFLLRPRGNWFSFSRRSLHFPPQGTDSLPWSALFPRVSWFPSTEAPTLPLFCGADSLLKMLISSTLRKLVLSLSCFTLKELIPSSRRPIEIPSWRCLLSSRSWFPSRSAFILEELIPSRGTLSLMSWFPLHIGNLLGSLSLSVELACKPPQVRLHFESTFHSLLQNLCA